MQNESGKKRMLTYVNSLTFSPRRVEARLSMTELALKSCFTAVSYMNRFQILLIEDLQHLSKLAPFHVDPWISLVWLGSSRSTVSAVLSRSFGHSVQLLWYWLADTCLHLSTSLWPRNMSWILRKLRHLRAERRGAVGLAKLTAHWTAFQGTPQEMSIGHRLFGCSLRPDDSSRPRSWEHPCRP